MCAEQHNTKTYIICTGVVLLGSPAAVVSNVAICKLTAWGMHNTYTKH